MVNSKVLIAIPSKRRAEIFYSNTYQWAPRLPMSIEVVVFLEREDMEAYQNITLNKVTLPKSNQGLGYAKEQIKAYAERGGFEYIFKVDDDIKGWTDFRQRLDPIDSAAAIRSVIETCVAEMEAHPEIAGVSFPYAFQMFEPYRFKKSKRVQTCYIFRTKDFHANQAISVHEDFAQGLDSIVKGKVVLCYGMTGMVLGVKVGGDKGDSTGGHQALDRAADAMKAMAPLQKIYPPLRFRKVAKPWVWEPDLRSVKVGAYI